MGELIDLMLETASYLDACHDADADRLRRKLRERAEVLFIERELADPLPDDVHFVEGDPADLLRGPDCSHALCHQLGGEA